MRLIWRIAKRDIANVRDIVARQSGNPLVERRYSRNLSDNRRTPSRSSFWKAQVACLLTTQQRSGPSSPVSRFLRQSPFPLTWGKCLAHAPPREFIRQTISTQRGLRRANRVSDAAAANLQLMQVDWWQVTQSLLRSLLRSSSQEAEREAARHISARLSGFGPKQSRNLLQMLGLTRYEIPLDSRIIRWLNANDFPLRLSANALGDEEYYAFVLDGLQMLCAASGVFPCVLDAAIFSSFDKEEWRPRDVIF